MADTSTTETSEREAEHAAWLADKIGALGDYAKEAAEMLRRWPVTQSVEPVALVDRRIGLTVHWTNQMEASRLEHGTPLYAAPQPSVSQEAGEAK